MPYPAPILNLVHLSRSPPEVDYHGRPLRFYVADINRKLDILGSITMARKTQSARNTLNHDPIQFINYRLNKGEQAAFSQWLIEAEANLDMELVQFISEGYKLSLSYDKDDDLYIAAATCKDSGNVNYGLCMTSRHKNWYHALLLGVFKTRELCEDGVWQRDNEGADWG